MCKPQCTVMSAFCRMPGWSSAKESIPSANFWVWGLVTDLALLLGCFSSISSWGVDKRENGESKVICVAHKAECLAVAIGLRHPEVAMNVFLQVALSESGGLENSGSVQSKAEQSHSISFFVMQQRGTLSTRL